MYIYDSQRDRIVSESYSPPTAITVQHEILYCAIVRNMSGYGFLDTKTAFKFEMTLAILNIV